MKQRALPDIEAVSAAVHQVWMDTKLDQGIQSRRSESGEELMVPYAQLSEAAKELDRGSVRAVYAAINTLRPPLADETAQGGTWQPIETARTTDRIIVDNGQRVGETRPNPAWWIWATGGGIEPLPKRWTPLPASPGGDRLRRQEQSDPTKEDR